MARRPKPHASTGHTPGPTPPVRRAVVAGPCLRSKAAVEHALLEEGYQLVDEGTSDPSGEPVLLFSGNGDGLHVLAVCDVAGALAGLHGEPGAGDGSFATGIHAFVPRPFGAADVLRVARAVGGFDCRRRVFER